ncbi:MAG: hypothetical protein NZ108_00875 [Bacteroidia bacterium]|nr:hypothetical protein [Bacteroidia bacterium]
MRFLVCWIVGLIILTRGFTQNTPPNVVLTAFQQRFPQANSVIWEEFVDYWRATIEQPQVIHSYWKRNGSWIETKRIQNLSALPSVIKKKFPSGWQLTSIYYSESVDREKYIIFFTKNDSFVQLSFTSTGQLLEIQTPETNQIK